jgi:hypothetical protein
LLVGACNSSSSPSPTIAAPSFEASPVTPVESSAAPSPS